MNDTNQVTNEATQEATQVKVQSKRGRPVDKHSAITKARAIYASLPLDGNSRKESVKAFMEIKNADGVNLSKHTAGAYYAVITRGQTRTA